MPMCCRSRSIKQCDDKVLLECSLKPSQMTDLPATGAVKDVDVGQQYICFVTQVFDLRSLCIADSVVGDTYRYSSPPAPVGTVPAVRCHLMLPFIMIM